MSSGKEIRNQIRSIQSTQKITRAMEMVAASKMQRTRQGMARLKPYSEKIYEVAQHVSESSSGYHHPYLYCPKAPAEDEKTGNVYGLIVVSTDRGLCGGLNANLFRAITHFLGERSNDRFTALCYGRKSTGFVRRLGLPAIAELVAIGDRPDIQQVAEALNKLVSVYSRGELDGVYLATNRFVSSLSQEPVIVPLLPLRLIGVGKEKSTVQDRWDYIYEPEPEQVMDQLMKTYIETFIYESLLENIACEMAARMVAMKSASDNAGELIGNLKVSYNKIRQASITEEISEIISGAAAI